MIENKYKSYAFYLKVLIPTKKHFDRALSYNGSQL